MERFRARLGASLSVVKVLIARGHIAHRPLLLRTSTRALGAWLGLPGLRQCGACEGQTPDGRSWTCPPFSIEIQFWTSVLHEVSHPAGAALVLDHRRERSVADLLRSMLLSRFRSKPEEVPAFQTRRGDRDKAVKFRPRLLFTAQALAGGSSMRSEKSFFQTDPPL